ncbi:MAG: aminotransferase class IV [Sulfurovaceae bacterium]|nr:aminotransferase class IV [Sulfurovaceae bacterium]
MFIETIKILNGKIYNIKWHNYRCNRTRQDFFNISKPLYLQQHIEAPPKGLFRCRILYAKEIISIEYLPYQPKKFKNFNIIQSNIEYNYKYAKRELLEQLKKGINPHNEVIIEKNGLLTDTSIANIAFYDGKNWLTPKTPLLEGTMRMKLLENGFLKEQEIKSDKLKHFLNFALMNAMIGFQIQKSITDIIKKEN